MAQQKAQGTITIIDTNDIESITVEYAKNQNSQEPPTSDWSTTRPAWQQGYFIWQRTRIHKSGTDASTDTFGAAVCLTGSTGSNGTSITISSIKYAISADETQPADSSFTYTTVPAVSEGSWLWTLTTYSNGSKMYTKSKQGVSGDSITISKVEYQSGTSPTAAPGGTWQTTIPTVAEGNYLWTKTTYSDGNYTYSVAKQGVSGTSVTISDTSIQYQVSSSGTVTPSGTWHDSVQSTTVGEYLWTRTIVTYSDNSSTTSYSVAAHGASGTSVSISSIKYAVSNTEAQPADSSFTSTTVPTVSEGQWLWTLTTYSNGSKMYTKSKQGESGDDGRGLITTETKYTNVAEGTTKTQIEALQDNAWVSEVPSYDSSKPDYWVRIKNTYDKAPLTEYIYYKDNATSNALATAALANSIATHSNENAQGAMSQAAANIQTITRLWYAKADSTAPAAPTTHVTTSSVTTYNTWNIKRPNADDSYPYYFYCDETCTGGGTYDWSEVTLDTSTLSQYQIGALTAKVKNFWWDSSGAHIASGKNGNEVTKETISTYGYHALMGLTGISFNYDGAKVVDLNSTTPSLDFYQPPTISGNTVTQGKKTMMLSANALSFYDPTNGTTEQAKLDTNGLVLKKGGIKAGTAGQSGFIYLSTENYGSNLTINSHQASNWREIIGTKFGVDADGNLYASNAEISGKITASSLTIGSGATVSGLSTSNITGMNDYALQSSLDTEVAQRKAVYAVSTTGATTAAKTTESGTPDGFVLYNGATVTVKFNSANSTTTPTLNVNGTGAKTIKSYTGAALSAAEYTWPAGAAITFTYDGSYWRMQDSGALQAKADAAASASAASGSATAASNSASEASTSASSASTSASNASNSASAASTSASTASTKASEASDSASTASTQASAASTSATNAANSASAASTSATNASNSASAAADSASDASDSADAAAGSASTASSKATAAANSATSASNSASSASDSATSASNSASSASSSATAATNQATAAAGSATAASNSATAASDSATAASNSATAASNSATAASDSATAASNSATAAAEVMGGFTILWNYSAFGTATAGDAFICGFDPATGTKSDANGWVKWNSTKRTITKQQVNPGTIVPYNIPIYIVCRLSSATGTTGTNYMVWYNAGWKYAVCPSPTVVGGSWTWTDNRDIILGSFVETGANEVLTECELFNPPWTSKQITTNTTTSTSYIMDTDSNKGITVKPKDSTGNDFLQMNSTAIEFFRNSTTASVMRLTDNSFRLGLEASNHTTIDTNGLHIWAGTESTATNEIALFSSTARIGKTNSSRFLIDTTKLQAYNSSNKLYFEVSSSGIKYGTDLSSTSTTTIVASQQYADEQANIAEANASYSIEIKITNIDYVKNSATLVAVPYYQGSTTLPTLPSGVNYSYRWYKGNDALSDTSTEPTINGAATTTLTLGEGSDLDAIYVCVISKS